jgi:hypothetical protein
VEVRPIYDDDCDGGTDDAPTLPPTNGVDPGVAAGLPVFGDLGSVLGIFDPALVTWAALSLAAVASACNPPDGGFPDASGVWDLQVELDRESATSPNPVIVLARITDGEAAGRDGESVVVEATAGVVSPVVDLGGGEYRALVTPGEASGAISIAVSVVSPHGELRDERTALVLPTIDDAWSQPEAVPGLVNTPGYEDGIEVSGDGQWLFVGSYSPVDAFCCTNDGCGTVAYNSAACQTVLGPYAAPSRPGMFGAGRIVSPTEVRNHCPSLCIVGDGGGDVTEGPLPPVAAFGFRRQTDGSFTEPFVIGFETDGCSPPFGLSLVSPGSDALFAYDLGAGDGHDIFWTPLRLGIPNVLGAAECVAGVPMAIAFLPERLHLSPLAGSQGNPFASGDHLFFDDEYTSFPSKILVAGVSGAYPTATIAPSADVPVGDGADDKRQPFLDGATLYYTRNFAVAAADLSGDPSVPASWSAPTTQLAAESSMRVGAIFLLGEPSVAHLTDGTVELYFVYATKTAAGVDLNAGRVRRRP